MTLTEHDQRAIDAFFHDLAIVEATYAKFASFSYFAVKRHGEFVLTQGRLFLSTAASDIPSTHFQTDCICAGNSSLAGMQLSLRGFVEGLVNGKVTCPDVELAFPGAEGGSYAVYHSPFHPEGLQNGNRLDVLTLTGAKRTEHFRQPHLDWEVKTASTPYDSVAELLAEYRLGPLRGDASNVEIVAFHVAAVDLSSSISGTIASPAILLAGELDPAKATLGFRIISQGRVIRRGSVSGSELQWSPHGAFQRGVTQFEIPQAGVLQCFATYAGMAQHQGWLSDPSTVQNPKRAIYDLFDGKLEILQDFLTKSQGKGRNARDLESGVSWLLWMLGFSVAHLGATGKTQEAPDLIASTPRGNIAVIECTTGLLKAESKLALLVERAEALKRRLETSGNQHLRVLPIIVTSKTREEVKADLEQAERLGVVVMTREALVDGLQRTLVLPDAEALFAEGERTARAAREKYQSSGYSAAG